jgi:hypothetical protein
VGPNEWKKRNFDKKDQIIIKKNQTQIFSILGWKVNFIYNYFNNLYLMFEFYYW